MDRTETRSSIQPAIPAILGILRRIRGSAWGKSNRYRRNQFELRYV